MGEVIRGILIPFLGTTLGASCVLFMKKMMNKMVQRALTGFAAGIMVSASVWSLLIPSMDYAAEMGKFAFVPAVVGFWIGILFLLAMDHIIPHLHMDTDKAEGPKSKLKKTTMLVFTVTLHNIPEGMAVGVVYAGYLAGNMQISAMGALALAIGIAIQNFPEGAIISMPLKAEGMSKGKAFLYGVLSGVVEPIGAVLTIVASGSYIKDYCNIAISFGICSRCNDLCCNRRINSRNVTRRSLKYWYCNVCSRFYTYDDS